MKAASPELIVHLQAANQFLMADLYTFILKNGNIHYFTTADATIVWAGHSYLPTALISRGSTRCTVGLEVDSLDMTIESGPALLINGVSFSAAAVRGDLDGATVRLDRSFSSDWAQPPIGALMLFEGDVSNVYCDRLSVKVSVKSMLEQFNVLMPRRVYQAACANALFDYSCGLVKGSYGSAGIVAAGSSKLRIESALLQPVSWCDLGTIEFTSGLNSGQKRTVKANAVGAFALVASLPFTPVVGDTFVAYPGCDKTLSTCTNKFGNIVRFRGQPYIPRPESVL